MTWPDLKREVSLWRSGWERVIGIDEVGRGALAGPVVAAAVCFDKQKKKLIPGIRDSKQLGAKNREYLTKAIKKYALAWAVSIVPEETIDRIRIGEAVYQAMYQAALLIGRDGFCLIDGNIYPKIFFDNNIHGNSIVKGDQIIYSIAAASIIAKTTRDQLMRNLDRDFPDYGWAKNKGYGTVRHRQVMRSLGYSLRHRQTFTLT